MAKGKPYPFSEAQKQIVRDSYLERTLKSLSDEFLVSPARIKRFLANEGLEIPKEVLEARKTSSQYVKGNKPHNTGKKMEDYMSPDKVKVFRANSFKKGNRPHNENPEGDGAIRILEEKGENNSRFYKWIRLSAGNWKLLHRHIWELVNGPVPEGYCLWFIDGDSLNAVLSNLELISRAENLRRNVHQFPPEIKKAIRLKNKINKLIKDEQKQ